MPYKERLKRVQKMLKEHTCDALLINNLTNVYYLTGIELSAGQVLVDTKGAQLIVDGRYIEMCKKKSPFPATLDSLSEMLEKPEFTHIKTLGFDKENTSYGDYLNLKKKLKKIELIPIDDVVKQIRSKKDPEEIAILSDVAALGSEGFDFVCSILKEGITEEKVATELEIFWKRKGGKSLAFDPIIAFGANSSMPHYHVNNTQLKKGDPVLIDIGVKRHHYHSDMTRVVFFGEPDPKMQAIYLIVQKAQQAALDLCRPGARIANIDSAARDLITGEGYGKLFSHGLGHGVGLEIHEDPVISYKAPNKEKPLEEGMVVTIEPGIYLPNIGGVRIEDTIVITADGYKNLTNRPKDLLIL